MSGAVAIVLHAHLPWVRHPEHARSLEERWLFEAIWETYLPLLDLVERLANEGVRAPFTLSISPTLAAMLRDPLLRARFEDHLRRTEAIAAHLARPGALDPAFYSALGAHAEKLATARRTYERVQGDLLAAFVAHHEAGHIELWTSAATHGYLPSLDTASSRAQLLLGKRGFSALAGASPKGLWLPECGYDERLGDLIAAASFDRTVLDAHGLLFARPSPSWGIRAPITAPSGVSFFGRDPEASRAVWSRASGYPGDPWYRDFHSDVGFDLPEEHLLGEVGPYGVRVMTGLKLHRVSNKHEGKGKEPYLPEAAGERANAHADHFLASRARALLSAAVPGAPPPLAVVPFDAELFGHWWFEGPLFLELVLRKLASSDVLCATTPGLALRAGKAERAEPAASSWGEGGFGTVWAGPESARLLRHVRHAGQKVREAVTARRDAKGSPGRALDQAIRELLLAQASDWPFMIRGGDMASYAEARAEAHTARALRLADMAYRPDLDPASTALLEDVEQSDNFLSGLTGDALRSAY